jgi:hypothetical protein
MVDAPPAPPPCKDHPDVLAIARCAVCNRPLCDLCFRFRMNERPACARCAYETATRPQRRVSLAAAFLSFAWGGGFWLVQRKNLWSEAPFFVVLGAIVAPVIAYFIGASARDPARPTVENREPGEDEASEAAFAGGASPYRARARRVLLAASPRISGKATALVIGSCLLASAVLLPASVKLPRWIEAEIVLGLWWIIVGTALVVMLYRGFRLRDDYVYFMPWDRPAESKADGKAKKGSGGSRSGCGGVDGCSGVADAEGCAGVIVVALVFVVALGAAWVLVELAMPLCFFLMYWMLMRAIGHVSRDRHDCEGALGRSIAWGALWATIYVAPIAGLTWAIHALHR